MLTRNTSYALSKIAAGILLGAFVSSATAQVTLSPSQLGSQYADMCTTQAVNIPAPYGEADLKDNPKLGAYCKCFGEKFAQRAATALQKGDVSASTKDSLQDTVKQEEAMRNGCRQQIGLPLLKFAN